MFYSHGHLPGLLLLLFTGVAHATSLSLADAERIALEAEPGHTALLERADSLREKAIAAGQLPDPKLRVALANFPLESGGFSTEGMTQTQIGFRQAFPPGQSRVIGTRRYESMAQELSENAAVRHRDVLLAVRTSWLEHWYWLHAGEVVNEIRPLFVDLVTVTQSLYSVGRRNQHDILRAELELSRLDDRLIEIKGKQATTRARLSEWVAQAAALPVDGGLPAWTSLPPLEQLQAHLEKHPAVLAADSRISAANDGIELARQQYKPGWAIDLGYAYRDGRLPTGMSRSDFATVSFTMDLPYFRKNRQDREVAAARSVRRAAHASKEQFLRQLASQLEVEYARWHELSRRIDLYQRQVLEQAHERTRAARVAYQSGTGDFADVMRGSIDELNTRLDFIRLQVDRAQSHAVVANLGGLTL